MFLPLRDSTPRLRYPLMTVVLIAINLAVYLYQMALPAAQALHFMQTAGLIPRALTHASEMGLHSPVPAPLTIYTSMFLHGSLLHLVGNMWFLWIFGHKLEGYVGRFRFLGGYLLAGTVAALLQVASAPRTSMPMIGASGAIAGVLGIYALTFPRARVQCLVFLIFFVTLVTLPASILLGLWFLGQFVASLRAAHEGEPGIAWSAHVGGFLSGLLIAWLFVPRQPRMMYHPLA